MPQSVEPPTAGNCSRSVPFVPERCSVRNVLAPRDLARPLAQALQKSCRIARRPSIAHRAALGTQRDQRVHVASRYSAREIDVGAWSPRAERSRTTSGSDLCLRPLIRCTGGRAASRFVHTLRTEQLSGTNGTNGCMFPAVETASAHTPVTACRHSAENRRRIRRPPRKSSMQSIA